MSGRKDIRRSSHRIKRARGKDVWCRALRGEKSAPGGAATGFELFHQNLFVGVIAIVVKDHQPLRTLQLAKGTIGVEVVFGLERFRALPNQFRLRLVEVHQQEAASA